MEAGEEALAFKVISPLHVAHLWHWIESGIQVVARKCDTDFIAADVYRFLVDNRCTAVLILEDGEYRGIAIVEVVTNAFKGTRDLNVWVLFYLGAKARRFDVMQMLIEVKNRAGCRGLEFKSPRLGWKVEAERLGFKAKLITWRYE